MISIPKLDRLEVLYTIKIVAHNNKEDTIIYLSLNKSDFLPIKYVFLTETSSLNK